MMNKVISITKATYLDSYNIELEFDDSTVQIIDFEKFILSARNPMISKFGNISEFKSFEILYGDLVWNDYEMSFPIWDLYTNNIMKLEDLAIGG